MGQLRNKTGVDFEKQICESNGWVPKSTKPKIEWVGQGRSNWLKMEQVNFDPTKFIPNIETSKFDKYDAITPKGEKVEIKKYKSEDLYSWTMYSEPIFKVATKSALKTVINKFGNGDYDKSVERYNEFLNGVMEHIGEEILNRITKSNIGIQCEDKFIPQSELEYKWVVLKRWKGYNRLSIVFRIKIR